MIELDFLARPARVPPEGLAVLVAGMVALDFTGARYADILHEAERARAQVAAKPRIAAPVARANPDELRQARAVVERLTAPWDELYAAVESSVGEDVALLAVQPDLGGRRVTLTAEARSIADGVGFAERLNRGGTLSGVFLSNHEVRTQDPQRPVRFTLEARWQASAAGAKAAP